MLPSLKLRWHHKPNTAASLSHEQRPKSVIKLGRGHRYFGASPFGSQTLDGLKGNNPLNVFVESFKIFTVIEPRVAHKFHIEGVNRMNRLPANPSMAFLTSKPSTNQGQMGWPRGNTKGFSRPIVRVAGVLVGQRCPFRTQRAFPNHQKAFTQDQTRR